MTTLPQRYSPTVAKRTGNADGNLRGYERVGVTRRDPFGLGGD